MLQPSTPPRLRASLSSWVVILVVLLLLAAFGLYFYAG
jgi:hypothetical protein